MYHSTQDPIVCNEKFPVLHYILSIEELENSSLMLNARDYDSHITTTLSFLKPDQKYTVQISACTEFTCRSREEPLTVCKSPNFPEN